MTAADITNATLRLYQYQDDQGGAYNVRLHRTNDDWVEAEVNWHEQPFWQATPNPIAETVSAGRGFKSFTVTPIARAWYANPQPSGEKGLAIVMADEAQEGGQFATAQCDQGESPCHDGTTGQVPPRLTIDYQPTARRNELYLTQSLAFTPGSPSPRGTNVTATFTVQNAGTRTVFIPEMRVNMQKKGTTTELPFPEVSGRSLAPGATYTYSQSQTLTQAGQFKGEVQLIEASVKITMPSAKIRRRP